MKKNYSNKDSVESKNRNKTKNYRKPRRNGNNRRDNNSSKPSGGRPDRPDNSNEFNPEHNDPSWYVTDKQMLTDIASMPFFYAGGRPYSRGDLRIRPIDDSSTYEYQTVQSTIRTPGILSLYLRPSLPVTKTSSDPVNIAARKIVTFLKHTISAVLPYEGPDVMCMLIAMANVYAYINFCMRAYAVAGLASSMNRYLNEDLLYSMGIDAIEFKSNLPQFRKRLNLLIREAATLAVPKSVKYFARTASLYTNIYTEGTAIPDQLYMFNPAGFFVMDESDGGINVKYKTFFSDTSNIYEIKLKTVDDLITYGYNMIEAVTNSDTAVLVSSNILRAYGDQGILKLDLLPDEVQIVPVFDIGILEQIANADILGPEVLTSIPATGWDIKQTVIQAASQIQFNPIPSLPKTKQLEALELKCRLAELTLKKVINTSTAYTGPELVLENSRLCLGYKDSNLVISSALNGDWSKTEPIQTASEVVTRVVAYVRPEKYNSSLAATLLGSRTTPVLIYSMNVLQGYTPAIIAPLSSDSANNVVIEPGKLVNLMSYITRSFRFMPKRWVCIGYDHNSTYKGLFNSTQSQDLFYLMNNLDNFTLVDPDELAEMNNNAAFALFDVPAVANAYK